MLKKKTSKIAVSQKEHLKLKCQDISEQEVAVPTNVRDKATLKSQDWKRFQSR